MKSTKKLSKIFKSKPFVISTASVLCIAIVIGTVCLFGNGGTEHTDFNPTPTEKTHASNEWDEIKGNSDSLGELNGELNNEELSGSLIEKLKRMSGEEVAAAYAVAGDPDYVPETLSSVVTDSKKPLPSNKPVITEVGGGSSEDGHTTVKPDKPQSGTGSQVPLQPKPSAPPSAAGSTPQEDEWAGHSDDVPQELYAYNYTTVPGWDLFTGKQVEYMGYTDLAAAAEAAKNAVERKFTVDYRNIKSTTAEDRDPYLCDLVYYVGETSQYDIASYMSECIQNKVVSQAEFITDKSLVYNNYLTTVRGRLKIKFDSGAGSYGLQNGIWYYKDIEVGIKKNNGEDRFGYGKSNDYQCLLFLSRGFVSLSDYKPI